MPLEQKPCFLSFRGVKKESSCALRRIILQSFSLIPDLDKLGDQVWDFRSDEILMRF